MYYEAKKKSSITTWLILAFLIAIIAILVIFINRFNSNFIYKTPIMEETGTDTVLNDFDIDNLVENARYSVVGVSKLNQKDTSIFIENSEEKLGIGSGIIISSNGYILTNYTVSGDKNSTCYVTLKNGEIYPAKIIWIDKNLDISIVKISANSLLALALGDSNKCSLGEEFYILSNPSGYTFKEELLSGCISATNYTTKIIENDTTRYIEDVIKIDKAISSSNTGSPVLNKAGEVIGITSSKINSVIPINRIKNILERVKKDENFEEPYLGIFGFDNNSLKYLDVSYNSPIGIYIDKVEENSPVYGKVESGDILSKIDDYELNSFQNLSEYLYTKSKGDTVKLRVIKGVKEVEIEVKLK